MRRAAVSGVFSGSRNRYNLRNTEAVDFLNSFTFIAPSFLLITQSMRGFNFGLVFLLLLGSCQRIGAPATAGAAAINRQDARLPAPDFTLPTAAGDSLTLSQLRGSYVLLDFRAADCAACQAENANLRKVYGQFRSRGLATVSVWKAVDLAGWQRAVATDSLAWPQVLDRPENSVAQAYEVAARPATVLLDPHGRELARDLHGRELGQKISEYIPLD